LDKNKLKILMDLRPCLDGFAGIPQETRLIFRGLNRLEEIELTGFINHGSRLLWPGLPQRHFFGFIQKQHKKVYRLSRLALSVKTDPLELWLSKAVHYINKKIEKQKLIASGLTGFKIPVYDFDARHFGDFIWQTLFSKTLAARDFEDIRNARFASMRPPQSILDQVSASMMRWQLSSVPTLDTRRYDIFLSQEPWPSNLPKSTQLVVRYHDAICVFLPHTVQNARNHQSFHMANLKANHKRGIFACTSAATRKDLLKILPYLERRSVVIPDIVSHEYYQQSGSREYVANIIRNTVSEETEPKFLTNREKDFFYQRNVISKPISFVLMVSTLEPRKNHMKLMRAWDYLKNNSLPDLKLVLVGSLGWDTSKIVDTMAPWQQRGDLFHLQRVPSGQLRILYNAADAVICPSVAEGFDVSGMEAMLCGGAVAASDIPVHREIYGNSCEYFNPYSMRDMAKAIENVIHHDRRNRREELITTGLKHAPQYRESNIIPLWQHLFERIREREFE
jgi:glycosyltransferase involved in cell wall biosynthesis